MSNRTKEAAKAIRAEVKKLGYTSKQVSVRTDFYSMGSSVKVVAKVPDVDLEALQKVAKGYQQISRCPYTGDILSGGNMYVFVSRDWRLDC